MDIKTQNRRLLILQLLHKDPDYNINDNLLQQLLSGMDHAVAMAVLRADLAWLEQLNLVSTHLLPNCTVAILRSEGIDVAKGLTMVPGINDHLLRQ